MKQHPEELERMLTYTEGQRVVPVIVDDVDVGAVTIGFGGT